MWLDKNIIKKIENEEIDYRSLMNNEENRSKPHISLFAKKFTCPPNFDQTFAKIKQEIIVNQEKYQKNKEYYVTKIESIRHEVQDVVDEVQNLTKLNQGSLPFGSPENPAK